MGGHEDVYVGASVLRGRLPHQCRTLGFGAWRLGLGLVGKCLLVGICCYPVRRDYCRQAWVLCQW